MRTVYGNQQRFETTYFKKFPGYYVTGDGEVKQRPLLAGDNGSSFTTGFQLLIVDVFWVWFGLVCPPGCRRDKDGYYWITGRIDDMLNVSGTSPQSIQQVAAVLLREESLLLFGPLAQFQATNQVKNVFILVLLLS